MFIDEKQLRVTAGKGGDGATLFRREIYVPRGGPDGGDGGRGGDVVIVGKHDLHALNHFAQIEGIRADDGKGGGHSRSTGKSGEESLCPVPLGTRVEVQGDTWEQVTEITEDGQRFVIAKGGNGGWGNWHFKSSVTQVPQRHNTGLPGEEKLIRLTLSLIADVGLVGLPNAGKSTLLAAISAARPKIADYPFTTLEPQLGVATVGQGSDKQTLVIADLPGLIEGASEGKGLGIQFLRHLERTKVVVHCIDSLTEPEQIGETYQLIRNELASWSSPLAAKPEYIALTKCELLSPDELEKRKQVLQKVTAAPMYSISAITHEGLDRLLYALL